MEDEDDLQVWVSADEQARRERWGKEAEEFIYNHFFRIEPVMKVHAVKQVKLQQHLGAMLKIDQKLYEQIMDTQGFAFHFNEICLLARTGDDWCETTVPESDTEKP